MGRRSINTTKSGKYMNPTDQARKEARKKELKKNKRQRQMVRAAVLKMKDPEQILDELQKIDEMEFNVLQPSPLNEKVLKEKRKKLKETFERVLKMYDKDEPEKWADLKRQEIEYEKRRAHLISYYESVKHAQSVQVDEIPLPTLQVPDNIMYGNMPSQIPLPADPGQAQVPKPILKKDTAYKEKPAGLSPPGPPPGPPPVLADVLVDAAAEPDHRQRRSIRFAVEDNGPPGETNEPLHPEAGGEGAGAGAAADGADEARGEAPKPTSLQQRMLALSGQNIDEFMREMEEVHKKRERDRAADLNARLSALKRKERRDSDSDSDVEGPVVPPNPAHCPIEPPGTAPLLPPGLRPPPLRAPPPAMLPRALPPGPPPGLPRAVLRPPGPPPGAPPRLLRPMAPPPPPQAAPASVLSAAPQLLPKKDGPQGATISAKPQIRNLSADVTRFVPSALRVKRDERRRGAGGPPRPARAAPDPPAPPTKDDAYSQFMREMQGLL